MVVPCQADGTTLNYQAITVYCMQTGDFYAEWLRLPAFLTNERRLQNLANAKELPHVFNGFLAICIAANKSVCNNND